MLLILQILGTLLVIAVFTAIPAAIITAIYDWTFWESYVECAKVVGCAVLLIGGLLLSIGFAAYLWSL